MILFVLKNFTFIYIQYIDYGAFYLSNKYTIYNDTMYNVYIISFYTTTRARVISVCV